MAYRVNFTLSRQRKFKFLQLFQKGRQITKAVYYILRCGAGLVSRLDVYAGRANYADGVKTQFIRCDKILFFIIAEKGCVLRFCVEGLQEFLEAGRRRFPAASAKLLGIDYALKILFDSQRPDLQLLGGQKAIGQQAEGVLAA